MAWTFWVITGAILGAVAVAMGAFGAHALKARLTADSLEWFDVAVRYQMYHVFALIAVGLTAMRVENVSIILSGLCFILGILLFSGSLYLLTLTDNRSFAIVTPLGGLLFIIGWIFLAVSVFRPA